MPSRTNPASPPHGSPADKTPRSSRRNSNPERQCELRSFFSFHKPAPKFSAWGLPSHHIRTKLLSQHGKPLLHLSSQCPPQNFFLNPAKNVVDKSETQAYKTDRSVN